MTLSAEVTFASSSRRRPVPWATLLLVAAFAVFFVIPLVYLLSLSFYTFVQPGVFAPDFTFDNYLRALTEPYAVNILLTSLRIAAGTTIGCMLLGMPLAMFVAREKGLMPRAVLIVLAASLFTNLVVRAYGWMIVLGPKGFINTLALDTDLIDRPLRLLGNEAGILIALVQELLPVFVIMAASSIQAVERSQEEAAAISGANWFAIFRRVILPVSAPGIVTGSVLVFLMALSSFVVPEFLGSGRVLTLATLIRQLISKVVNYPFAAALSVLLVLVIFMMLGVLSFGARLVRRKS